MRRAERKSINLLELTPMQRVPWEQAENGTVVVLVPKFRNPLVVRYVVPHLRYPHVRVKLDAMGSCVWKLCDGKTTVAAMAEQMIAEFGDSATAAHDRIRTFLLTLERTDLVKLYDQGAITQQ